MSNDSTASVISLCHLFELCSDLRSSLSVPRHLHRNEKLSIFSDFSCLPLANSAVPIYHKSNQSNSSICLSLVTLTWQLVFYLGDRTFLSSLSSYLILLIAGSTAVYTCNLLGYHCMISSRALTTREDDKGIYLNGNPFDRHSWYENLGQRLCTSLPPSACE